MWKGLLLASLTAACFFVGGCASGPPIQGPLSPARTTASSPKIAASQEHSSTSKLPLSDASTAESVTQIPHTHASIEPNPVSPYVRIQETATGGTALQVVARELLPANPSLPIVILVGVVHIGTPEYYGNLQNYLDSQGRVLFEGIGASDPAVFTDRKKGGEDGLQEALASAMGLVFQLDAIQYDRPNFSNSDLDPEQLQALFQEMSASAEKDAEGTSDGSAADLDAVFSLLDGSSPWAGILRTGLRWIGSSPRLRSLTKVTMMEVIGQLEGEIPSADELPPSLRNLLRVLMDQRNQKVVADVQSWAHQQPPPFSIAVFYGAGHMTAIERQLLKEARYQAASERWFTAFDVTPEKDPIRPSERAFIQNLLRGAK